MRFPFVGIPRLMADKLKSQNHGGGISRERRLLSTIEIEGNVLSFLPFRLLMKSIHALERFKRKLLENYYRRIEPSHEIYCQKWPNSFDRAMVNYDRLSMIINGN